MGSCVSIHRNSESAMKFKLSFGSKTDGNGMVIPPSPIKENTPINGNHSINGVFVKSQKTPSLSVQSFIDNGSKDEDFFDSRAWLDSDCDDDFFSVNGDFTPSRGNTPVHPVFSGGNPRRNQVHVMEDQIPAEPSPTGKNKKLAELFRDSSRNGTEKQESAKLTTLNDLVLNSNPEIETPHYMSGINSVCSSERTSNGDIWMEKKEKPVGSVKGCLPSLVSCRSFTDRRKKMSPAPAIAVNE